MIACLSNDDNRLRAAAANALNELVQSHQLRLAPNADQVVTNLISAFEKEETWSANAAMAEALGNFGDSRAIAPLYRKAAGWNIASALVAGQTMGLGLSRLGAGTDQVSSMASQPIDALLAVAKALANLGKSAEDIMEMLRPALERPGLVLEHGQISHARVPDEVNAFLLLEIRKQAATKASQRAAASSTTRPGSSAT